MHLALIKPWAPRVLPPVAGPSGFGFTEMPSIYLPVVKRRMLGPRLKIRQSPDNAHSVDFSQRSSSPCLIEDETFNDSVIMNNLMHYEAGQEEPDFLRVDKSMQGSSIPTNWKSIFFK
ncbi:uncharacterized protein TNCV_955571 [Trichonephila clavipes]|nr:uncharacterized protein TNCV_955571 [Trichonephila clavipes]